mgnify:FL=1
MEAEVCKAKEKWVVDMEAELVPLHAGFLRNRWEDLFHMKRMGELLDFEGLKRLGHTLLGTPGAFGYDYLVEIGRELEDAAIRQDLSLLPELVARYENFMSNHEIRVHPENFGS